MPGSDSNRRIVSVGRGPNSTRSPSAHHRSTPSDVPSATTASSAAALPCMSATTPSFTSPRPEQVEGGVERVPVPHVQAQADDGDERHHRVLALLGPVVDHQHEVEDVEQEAGDQRDRREEAEDETEADGALAEHDEVR